MTNPRPVELKLLQLHERFRAALPKRIDEIAEALAEHDLPKLERKLHSLAGTAGTYGLHDIYALAAEGEEACGADTPVCAQLFDRLHTLINAMRYALAPNSAARILCVDDDPMHTWYVAAILKSAGYEIFTAVDGAEFRAQLSSVRPDLIVMDYVLPDATGVDLARMVRNDPSYATVPIVFLTGRRGVQQRIEATNVGGDDFLVKPVEAELLLSVIASRLERSRSMRALIDRDGLTGILNRSAFMRRAETAIAASKRQSESTALVMLDLDYFKAINDRHGHLAGDQVLKTFGTFLTDSVRPGDDVGRYGGEEFALLLRNISPEHAQHLVTRLLAEFGRVPFRGAGDQPFRVTFSAGVAMLDGSSDLNEWLRRADDALYVAKQNGRARIEAA